jgi:type VI protein secretion system component VasK
MDLHPAVMVVFAIVLGLLALVILVWFFAAIGGWADEAFENQSWLILGALMLFTFPGGIIAWLIIRGLRVRPTRPEDFLRRGRSAERPTEDG